MFEIKRPTLLLDWVKCERNIDILVAKARLSNVVLRPHFKTHQSHEIGRWFSDIGVDRCTVSSLEMAEYFASDDWNNITVAFPLNHLEGDRINQLAAKVKLNLLVSVADVLPKLLNTLKNEVGIFIEIDTGYHRTGIDGHDQVSLEKVMDEIDSSRLVRFEGFLSHAGHTYKCKSKDEIEAVHKSEVDILLRLKREYHRRYPDLILSIGDTPSASVVDEFSEVNEIRAGNLVFYDLTQHKIGSCELNQIAVALACPVVATYPERNEIVTY
ncbi:MAG: alanine racemase, partial [Cyclobacteriaceae bacterium]